LATLAKQASKRQSRPVGAQYPFGGLSDHVQAAHGELAPLGARSEPLRDACSDRPPANLRRSAREATAYRVYAFAA